MKLHNPFLITKTTVVQLSFVFQKSLSYLWSSEFQGTCYTKFLYFFAKDILPLDLSDSVLASLTCSWICLVKISSCCAILNLIQYYKNNVGFWGFVHPAECQLKTLWNWAIRKMRKPINFEAENILLKVKFYRQEIMKLLHDGTIKYINF